MWSENAIILLIMNAIVLHSLEWSIIHFEKALACNSSAQYFKVMMKIMKE